MNQREIEPWDESMRQLLAAEKSAPGAPPGTRARLLAKLAAGALALPGDAVPRSGAPSAGLGAPSAGPGALPAGALARLARSAFGPVALAFAAGGAAGASAQRWLAPPAPGRIVYVEVAPSSSANAPGAARVEPAAADTAQAPAPAPSAKPRSSATADSDLGAERVVLDRARAAFGRGDNDAALAALTTHARQFPRGRLEEEREALAVKALVDAGRIDEAKARGARFRGRFPQSFHLPAVAEALGRFR